MANAQKALRSGKVDKAIKEFERILDDDPNDIRSKLKMADLYVKGERFDDALRAYGEVAYSYAKQDLYEKAAAVYKQAMRISPEDPELYTQLGDAYFRLGRLKDAVRVFHKAQKIHKRDGDVPAQRDILERMVHIDPEDVGLQIQLAERYEKDSMTDQARALFRDAADKLKEEGRFDEYVQVVERMIYLSPQSVEMRKEVVRVYLGRGDEKHALKHLQFCFKLNAQDIDTLELLGSTFHRLGAEDKAVLVYAELAALYERNGVEDRAAAAYRTILTIDGTHADALRFLGQSAPKPQAATLPERTIPEQPVYELDLDEFEEDDALDGIEFLDDDDDAYEDPPATDEGAVDGGFLAFAEDAIRDLESDADLSGMDAYPEVAVGGEHTAAAEISSASLEIIEEPQLDQVTSASVDGDDQINQFLTESDVFLKYGLLDRAEDVITKVLSLSPNSLGGREQMRKLLVRMGDKRGAAHQLVEMARITSGKPESAVFLDRATALVDPQTLKTLAISAGLQVDGDFAASFLSEVSEGLDEISSTVEGQLHDMGALTIDLPEIGSDSRDEFALSGESAVDDAPPPLPVGEVSEMAIELDDEDIDSFDVADFDDVGELDADVEIDLGTFEVGELDDFDASMSLEGESVVDLDVDAANFDASTMSALQALDNAALSGEVDLNFSAEDADLMFDELFGGPGAMFGDSDEGIEELDLDDSDAFERTAPPSAFGARSLTHTFDAPGTNPSLEIDMGVNNSSLELGMTYKDMGLFAEAIEEFRHAMDDLDAAPAALYNIALCHLELGEKSDAQTHLTQLTEDEAVPSQWRSMASEKLGELTA